MSYYSVVYIKTFIVHIQTEETANIHSQTSTEVSDWMTE